MGEFINVAFAKAEPEKYAQQIRTRETERKVEENQKRRKARETKEILLLITIFVLFGLSDAVSMRP